MFGGFRRISKDSSEHARCNPPTLVANFYSVNNYPANLQSRLNSRIKEKQLFAALKTASAGSLSFKYIFQLKKDTQTGTAVQLEKNTHDCFEQLW